MKILVGVVILLALPFAGLVIWLVVSYKVEHLGQIGEFLQGVGQVALALGVIAGGGWAFNRYFEERSRQAQERDREAELRRYQAGLDVARLGADAVTLARQRYERARQAEAEHDVLDDLQRALERAEDEYDGTLRGLPRVVPELGRARQEAITASIEDMAREVDRLRRESGGLP